ncbi:ABC transporter permease [Roseococcus suduntuyensis]|uniref:NitT/TauT family transport system permease protein n=1 Tax=Roseococcus suduntuyensis TaxID=455361 RepID=A0A840A420_9PROT|nr:ABC transporter permease [Roseococcus suduntuyensis]MBB3896668.1 NitT/TauT family transport system permease protein [Roseococcus suduntuyensis]
MNATAMAALRLLGGVILAGLVWEGVVVLFGIRPHLLPRLSEILAAIAFTPGAYWAGLQRTAAETLIGFAAGTAVGIVNGLVFFRAPLLRDMLLPVFVVSQTIPVIAFGALVVMWFGNTLMAKAVIAFYLTFFPVTVNTLLGLNSVDPRQAALLRSFGATPTQILFRLQLPMALPQIFVALRLGASLSLVGAIVGEWFGDNTGIGVLLLQAMYNESVVALWAAILCAALLGTGFYALVAWAERRIVFWGAEQ